MATCLRWMARFNQLVLFIVNLFVAVSEGGMREGGRGRGRKGLEE